MNYEALTNLGYGMYLVSSIDEESGKSNAMLASLVMQVSSDPPTLCVSISKNNYSHELIEKSRKFNVSVLTTTASLDFMGSFGFISGKGSDKIANANCQDYNGIQTVVENCNSVIECELSNTVDLGQSTVFFGKIKAMKALSREKTMTYDHYQDVMKGGISQNSPARIAGYVFARGAK